MEQAKVDAAVGDGWAGIEWEIIGGERSTLPLALFVDGTGAVGAAGNLGGKVKVRFLDETTQTWAGDWYDTGAPIAGAPAATRANDGRAALFYREPGGALMCLAQNKGTSSWAAPFQPAGARLLGDPVIGHNGDGRIEVHFVGGDGSLWHVWSDDGGLEKWGQDQFGGGNIASLAVTTTTDGRQAFFHANQAGELWLIQQNAANGYWSGFTNPATGIGGPIAAGATQSDTLLLVFASHQAGSDNVLSHARQDPSGTWSGPQELYYDETARPNTDPRVRPALLTGPHGRLIAVHANHPSLWVIEQPADPSQSMGAWKSVWYGPQYYVDQGISAVIDAKGRLLVIAGSTKFGPWCFRYTPS